ncbi:MAG: ATP-binding protein [Variovorax sp.]
MKLAAASSIRQKLNIILTTTTAVALLLAGLALVLFDLRSRLLTIEGDLVALADMIALVSSPAMVFDDPKVASENLSVLRARSQIAAAALFDQEGRLFASFQGSAKRPAPLPTRTEPAGVIVDAEWVKVWRPVMAQQEVVGTVHLMTRHNLWARSLEYLGVLALVLTLSLLAALALANRLQRSVTGPVLAISKVAREILDQRDFSLRAKKVSSDEVGSLVDVFNAMLDELGSRARTLEHANQALRESDERYQLAVRGSSAGLWDWDMVADTMFYSPRFKSALGYGEDEFPNRLSSMRSVTNDEDVPLLREALRAHLSDDRPYHVECRMQLKGGAWRWFLITGAALKDGMGKPFRMAGSVIDITERKEAEQVVREANRAKDEFLATLAHELRNPLAPIRTGLDILSRDEKNGPVSRRTRETMKRQLAHMVRLIDDLMDISRINSGKIRLETSRINLSAVLETAVELSRPGIDARAHQFSVDIQRGNISLMGDATRLAQAVGNLLNNAAKYTPAGGRVTLRAWQEDAVAVVEVGDTGTGIPAEMCERVFSLFTQVGRTLDNAQGGLGIGLYLVRTLVEMHGGTVTAASAGLGRGSTFTLRVPCLNQVPSAGASLNDDAGSRCAVPPLKVLVVDDNADAAEALATALAITGHSTHMVHDGREVLEAARGFRPDAVLLDIGLPGLNGYEVAEQLRADAGLGKVVMIAITGWGSDTDRGRAKEAGFDHHLTKPVDFATLEALLRGAIESSRAAGD